MYVASAKNLCISFPTLMKHVAAGRVEIVAWGGKAGDSERYVHARLDIAARYDPNKTWLVTGCPKTMEV